MNVQMGIDVIVAIAEQQMTLLENESYFISNRPMFAFVKRSWTLGRTGNLELLSIYVKVYPPSTMMSAPVI